MAVLGEMDERQPLVMWMRGIARVPANTFGHVVRIDKVGTRRIPIVVEIVEIMRLSFDSRFRLPRKIPLRIRAFGSPMSVSCTAACTLISSQEAAAVVNHVVLTRIRPEDDHAVVQRLDLGNPLFRVHTKVIAAFEARPRRW